MVVAKAMGHDIEVMNDDGVTIYYNFINDNTELEVTYRGSSYDSREYSGSVVIPESLTYNNKTYNVISIGEFAFSFCHELTEVAIPYGITSIGRGAFYG